MMPSIFGTIRRIPGNSEKRFEKLKEELGPSKHQHCRNWPEYFGKSMKPSHPNFINKHQLLY